MDIRIKGFVVASLLGCGLLAHIAPASATIIDLVRENFNNIALPASGERTLADVLANTPDQLRMLPAGTVVVGAVNVRAVDNDINTMGGDDGFHKHFTSNFLVLGDETGKIGGAPTNENSRISIPFVIPANAIRIIISYRDAFNGTDTNPGTFDEFVVRLNGPGPALEIEFLPSPAFETSHTGIALDAPVFDDADPLTISPGAYSLIFRLNESGGGDTNTAVGLDRIRVRVEIPEPATLLLLAIGLAGLAGWNRRQTRQAMGQAPSS